MIKEGEVGADVFLSLFTRSGSEPVGAARRLLRDVDVLIPKFFRFLGFFAGVVGLCSSKKVFGEQSDELVSVLLDRKSATKEDGVAFEMGDSGDGPGEGSVTDEESIVEMVVVGELSDDSDANVEVLSRCTWKAAKGPVFDVGPTGKFPLEAGRPTWLPWAPSDLFFGSSFISLFAGSSPNTDIKVGMGGTKVREVD